MWKENAEKHNWFVDSDPYEERLYADKFFVKLLKIKEQYGFPEVAFI